MLKNGLKIDNLFSYWLITSLILVLIIIIIGGLTRLTNSGLSIIEWELFSGILPPLNDVTWNIYFEKYKTIPQYKVLNFDMSLDDFKIIFWWEYVHRILARIIGLFFLLPLIYFYLSNKINNNYLKKCFFILSLIILQGFLGWYMVKSGLVNNVSVSHYRLSLHLITAILIISSLFWLVKNVSKKKNKSFFIYSKKYLLYQCLIILIFFQIIMGAFVSGLDAGMIYQTWPLMGNSYFPNDLDLFEFKTFLNLNNHSLVQFYHRNLAYFIILYSLFLSFVIFKKKEKNLYKPLKILLLIISLQIFLGIITLINNLNIYLASAHQITSVLLVFSALNLYFLKVK